MPGKPDTPLPRHLCKDRVKPWPTTLLRAAFLGGSIVPIRLAVVDGHTLTRLGLRGLAAQHDDIEIVAECGSAAEAPGMLTMARPDVVIVDVGLPDADGLDLARGIRDRFADLGIVVLTSQDQDDVLFRALETGVSAFVTKAAPVGEILGAIRHAAVAGSSFTASGLASAVARRRSAHSGQGLSPRETEVLRLLRDGLSIPAIAAAMFISHSTAKTYVARLYEKLGATNRTQAMVTAMHRGLIRYEERDPASAVRQPPHRGAGRSAAGTPLPRGLTAADRSASIALTRARPRCQPLAGLRTQPRCDYLRPPKTPPGPSSV